MPEEEQKSTQDQMQEVQPKENVASVPGAEQPTAETLIEPVVHSDPQQQPPESAISAPQASSIPTVQVDVAISQSDRQQ